MEDDFGRRVVVYLPEDVVRCSFMVQKTLTPLDLSTSEFSGLTPIPFTEEGFQKLFGVEDRRVLFEYHLDIAHGLENALRKHDPVFTRRIGNEFETSVYRGVKLSEHYEIHYFLWDYIMQAIKNSPNKIAELKKHFPLLKIMQISSGCLEIYQCMDLACILHEECTDSEFVAEFIEVCGKICFFYFLLFNSKFESYTEYFLHHAQIMKIEVHFEGNYRCPVSERLLRGQFQCAITLIKYGKIRPPLNEEVNEFSIYILAAMNRIKCNHRSFEELILCLDNFSCIRKWLFLLLVNIFGHIINMKPTALLKSYDLGIQALRLMWRSTPEAFLSRSEILSVWKPDSDLTIFQPTADHVCNVYTFYKSKIIDGGNKDLDEEGPRSLQHLARCEIRGRLAANCALPNGIQLLGLPQPLQKFLRLEC